MMIAELLQMPLLPVPVRDNKKWALILTESQRKSNCGKHFVWPGGLFGKIVALFWYSRRQIGMT